MYLAGHCAGLLAVLARRRGPEPGADHDFLDLRWVSPPCHGLTRVPWEHWPWLNRAGFDAVVDGTAVRPDGDTYCAHVRHNGTDVLGDPAWRRAVIDDLARSAAWPDPERAGGARLDVEELRVAPILVPGTHRGGTRALAEWLAEFAQGGSVAAEGAARLLGGRYNVPPHEAREQSRRVLASWRAFQGWDARVVSYHLATQATQFVLDALEPGSADAADDELQLAALAAGGAWSLRNDVSLAAGYEFVAAQLRGALSTDMPGPRLTWHLP